MKKELYPKVTTPVARATSLGYPTIIAPAHSECKHYDKLGHIVLIYLRMNTGVFTGTFGNRPSMSEPAMRTHPCEAGEPRRFTFVVP